MQFQNENDVMTLNLCNKYESITTSYLSLAKPSTILRQKVGSNSVSTTFLKFETLFDQSEANIKQKRQQIVDGLC